MFISHGRQYIFIHIPKTGGTSMALALEERAKKDDILIGDTPKAAKRRRRFREADTRGRLWKHSTLADIEGLVGADEVERYFTFTMVRNPWDRAVSYYHWLRGQGFEHPAVELAKALDFKAFIAHSQTRASFRASPASSYMCRSGGGEQCSAYIRIEHFEADADPLFQHLGFRLELPRVNRSDRPADYRAAYDTRTKEIIAEDCAEDIARFGYRFV